MAPLLALTYLNCLIALCVSQSRRQPLDKRVVTWNIAPSTKTIGLYAELLVPILFSFVLDSTQ